MATIDNNKIRDCMPLLYRWNPEIQTAMKMMHQFASPGRLLGSRTTPWPTDLPK